MRMDRYSCVVDGCDWTLGDPGYDLPDGLVGRLPGLTLIETVARARGRATEAALRVHLETHDVVAFVETIVRLREEVETLLVAFGGDDASDRPVGVDG